MASPVGMHWTSPKTVNVARARAANGICIAVNEVLSVAKIGCLSSSLEPA